MVSEAGQPDGVQKVVGQPLPLGLGQTPLLRPELDVAPHGQPREQRGLL